ncbi:hypothetical protein B566_EDAN017962 [Ephemera danica]|nr:hypothetical protein B566_EDAN017962 [Ephemera danica]
MDAEGIKIKFTSPYHPASNPVERVMREIGRICRAYCYDKHTRWPDMIPKLIVWLNITTHDNSDADQTADEVIVQARQRMQKRARARQALASKSGKYHEFNIGDLVLIRSHRLSSKINKEMSNYIESLLCSRHSFKYFAQKVVVTSEIRRIHAGVPSAAGHISLELSCLRGAVSTPTTLQDRVCVAGPLHKKGGAPNVLFRILQQLIRILIVVQKVPLEQENPGKREIFEPPLTRRETRRAGFERGALAPLNH